MEARSESLDRCSRMREETRTKGRIARPPAMKMLKPRQTPRGSVRTPDARRDARRAERDAACTQRVENRQPERQRPVWRVDVRAVPVIPAEATSGGGGGAAAESYRAVKSRAPTNLRAWDSERETLCRAAHTHRHSSVIRSRMSGRGSRARGAYGTSVAVAAVAVPLRGGGKADAGVAREIRLCIAAAPPASWPSAAALARPHAMRAAVEHSEMKTVIASSPLTITRRESAIPVATQSDALANRVVTAKRHQHQPKIHGYWYWDGT